MDVLKEFALLQAVQTRALDPNQIVQQARDYEAFLRGDSQQPKKLSKKKVSKK